jgi:hypothetical protein
MSAYDFVSQSHNYSNWDSSDFDPFFLLCALLAACADPGEPLNSAGRLQNADIREASGLAHSNIDAGRLWVINDGGAGARLYAAGIDGSHQAVVEVDGARNRDWEDLASFVLDDKPMLLIADIGDNLARRGYLTLYVLEVNYLDYSLPGVGSRRFKRLCAAGA